METIWMKCQILFSRKKYITSNEDDLHEKSNPVFWENKKMETMCMNCFLGENKKNISKCRLFKKFTQGAKH